MVSPLLDGGVGDGSDVGAGDLAHRVALDQMAGYHGFVPPAGLAVLDLLKQEYTKGEILDALLSEYGIKKTQAYSEIKAAQKLAKDLYNAD